MSEFRKLVEQMMANAGGDDTGIIEPAAEPWSLAHAMTVGIMETSDDIRVDHPSWGTGVLQRIDEAGEQAEVKWDMLKSWSKHDGKINLEEAQRVVVVDSHKYVRNELSEEIDMTKIDMSYADYENLMEDTGLNVPAPSDSILTKQSNDMPAGEAKPLSGLDGEGGKTNEPHEEGGTVADAPGTPPVASMDEPSRKAKVSQGGGGSGSNQFKKTNKSSDGDADKSSDSSDDKESSEEDKMKNESITLEDMDVEGIFTEMGDMDMGASMSDAPMQEHDMAAGEIAVTQDFMVKLITAASAASLSDDNAATIAQAIADCCSEDRTLDVADIGEVMSSLKGDGGTAADPADPAGDEFDGAEDDADLMGDDDVEECGYMDEGSQEDRDRGRKKRANKKADKSRFHRGDKQRPKYQKPRADDVEEAAAATGKDEGMTGNKGKSAEERSMKVKEGDLPDALKKHKIEKGSDADGDGKTNEKEDLEEAWIAGIPHAGNKIERLHTDGMDDDDAEIAEIKRRARVGMDNKGFF